MGLQGFRARLVQLLHIRIHNLNLVDPQWAELYLTLTMSLTGNLH